MKIYFASDFHLGVPDRQSSLERERRIVKWLDEVSTDATEIFLVGDLFDFWFEYRSVIPKGHTRLLGAMSRITDKGIPLHVFTGNHDMWMFGYLTEETGAILHRSSIEREWNGRKFYIAHGDGLGPGDHGYKFIKAVFANPVCQWLFGWLHPDIGIRLANFWSGRSRHVNSPKDAVFEGKEKERLYQFALSTIQSRHFDYFVFGHRHLPLDIEISNNSRMINLGDWISHFSYAEFDGEKLELRYYSEK